MANYYLSQSSIANLETLLKSGNRKSRILVAAVKDFIKHTPIDFGIIVNGGFRTAAEQKELFDRGVSKCDGYKNKSMHQSGLAVDLVPYVNGAFTWDEKSCFYLSGAFMAYLSIKGVQGVTTGADWNADGDLKDGWDPCHMQIL